MYSFQVIRNARGELQAQTRIPLGSDRRELRITTDKGYRGGLDCDARVVQVSEDGCSYQHAFGLARDGSGDFSKNLATDRTKRATAKAIETMHRECLALAPAVLDEARAYYAAQAAA